MPHYHKLLFTVGLFLSCDLVINRLTTRCPHARTNAHTHTLSLLSFSILHQLSVKYCSFQSHKHLYLKALSKTFLYFPSNISRGKCFDDGHHLLDKYKSLSLKHTHTSQVTLSSSDVTEIKTSNILCISFYTFVVFITFQQLLTSPKASTPMWILAKTFTSLHADAGWRSIQYQLPKVPSTLLKY